MLRFFIGAGKGGHTLVDRTTRGGDHNTGLAGVCALLAGGGVHQLAEKGNGTSRAHALVGTGLGGTGLGGSRSGSLCRSSSCGDGPVPGRRPWQRSSSYGAARDPAGVHRAPRALPLLERTLRSLRWGGHRPWPWGPCGCG